MLSVRDAAQPRGLLVAVVLAALMALHVLPYAWSTVILDTARDLVAAQRIVDGVELPLRGPVINAMFNLGPAWFYVVAAFLALAHDVTGTLVLVGALAALKFPLAYAFGARWRDARTGLLMALALTLPGWNLAQQVLVTHWNLVEAATLAAALPLLALARDGRARSWLAYGLLQSLALHAHPATIVLALALPYVAWRRRAQWRGDLACIVAGVAASLLPFAPMLVAEARDGWPMLEAIARYASAPPPGLGVVAYLEGATRGGTTLFTDALASHGARPWLIAAYALVATAAIVGHLRAWRAGDRRAVLALTMALPLALLALRALRPLTPFYMVLPWLPLLAAWIAFALAALTSPIERVLRGAACVALALLAIAAPATLLRRASQGAVPLPLAAFGDVAQRQQSVRVALLPALELDRLGADLCAHPGTVLHGHLAVLVDSALSLGSRLRCGASGDPGIGGGAQGANEHRLGLVPQALRALGMADASWQDARTLRPKRVLAAEGTQPVPDGSAYPFRERGAGTPSVLAIEFAVDAGERVVVANAFTVYDGARIIGALANGRRALRVHETNDVVVFACDGCAAAGKVDWRVEVETGWPDRLDVVTY